MEALHGRGRETSQGWGRGVAGSKNPESAKGRAHGRLGSNPSSRAYKVQCKPGDMTSFL